MDPDSEQIFHDLEQRHVLLRKEHDIVCIEREAFKGDQLFPKALSNCPVSRSTRDTVLSTRNSTATNYLKISRPTPTFQMYSLIYPACFLLW